MFVATFDAGCEFKPMPCDFPDDDFPDDFDAGGETLVLRDALLTGNMMKPLQFGLSSKDGSGG